MFMSNLVVFGCNRGDWLALCGQVDPCGKQVHISVLSPAEEYTAAIF